MPFIGLGAYLVNQTVAVSVLDFKNQDFQKDFWGQ
jgi:hypothetical protein